MILYPFVFFRSVGALMKLRVKEDTNFYGKKRKETDRFPVYNNNTLLPLDRASRFLKFFFIPATNQGLAGS
jgi:hypothetical protein